MPLSAAEQKQLDALTKKANEVDPDDEMEVRMEVEGKTIYLPYKKAKPWLKKQGIDLDDILEEAPEEEGEEGDELEGEEEGEVEGEGRPKARKRPVKKAEPEVVATRGKSYWRRPEAS